jgi:hypothetical protein
MHAVDNGLLFIALCILGAWGYHRRQEIIKEKNIIDDLIRENERKRSSWMK